MKALKRKFHRVDRNRNHCIDTDEELAKIKEVIGLMPLMKELEGEFARQHVDWRANLDALYAKQGNRIAKWEMMDFVEELLQTRFWHILNDPHKDTPELIKTLEKLEATLAKENRRHRNFD